jgi:nitrile hydratase accessory protein
MSICGSRILSLAEASQLPGLPLDGGEPAFAEPWQAQAFALALQLHRNGAFTWAEWTEALTEQLRFAGPADDGSRYYEHWLAALEGLVSAKSLLAPAALVNRKQAWAEAYRHTPHGQPVEIGAGDGDAAL